MRNEKFIYNTQTLQYEKVVEPLQVKIFRVFGFVCAAVVTAFVFTLISHRFFPSPTEKAQKGEIEALKEEIRDFYLHLGKLQNELNYLQEKDAYAYRTIFEMDPIDEGVWKGGIGGHIPFEQNEKLNESGELVASLRERVDLMKRQMVLQSKSLDTILNRAKESKEYLAAMPSIKPVRSDKLVRHMSLMSGFGMRMHPVLKVPKMHYGIDFTAPSGTAIQATGNGTVIRSEYSATYGHIVEIDHGYNYRTRYAHCSKILVKKGEKVTRGQKIGLVGSTGRSTAPHCHYEVLFKGQQINPIRFCMDGLSPEEYDQMVKAAVTANQAFDYE